MRLITRTVLLILPLMSIWADPPDEDVLRPDVPSKGAWFVQLDLGLNASFLANDSYRFRIDGREQDNDFLQSASGITPWFGATLGYRFSPRFGLNFRIDYDPRSVSHDGGTVDTCLFLDTQSGGFIKAPVNATKEFQVEVDYLSFSLLPVFYFDRLFLFVGPTVSVPLNGSVTETDQLTNCEYFSGTPDASTIIRGVSDTIPTAVRVSGKLGLGYTFPVSEGIEIVPQLGVDFGFTNTLDRNDVLWMVSPNPNPSLAEGFILNEAMRITSVQASVGLRITL